jgi:hypothetical protein
MDQLSFEGSEDEEMERPVPYEHRGKMYRELRITSQSEAEEIGCLFRAETDVWLKKLLASKLLDVLAEYDCGVPESDIREAIRCRVR